MTNISIIRNRGRTCDSNCHYYNSIYFNKQLSFSEDLFFSYYDFIFCISFEFDNDVHITYEPGTKNVLKTIGLQDRKHSKFMKYNSAEFEYVLGEFKEFNSIINKAKNGANMIELYDIWQTEYL
jgi:hypothetical protein